MSLTAVKIDARFRYAINDSSKEFVDPADALELVAAWRNEALQKISSDVPFIDRVGYIHPNGSRYSFDLPSELKSLARSGDPLAFQPCTGYLKLRLATIFGSGGVRIVKHPQGLQYIRRIEATGSGVYATTPNYYALKGGDIYFDGVEEAPADPNNPVVSELFTVDYWALHPSISGDESPEYPLREEQFMNLIIATMKSIQNISGERGDKYKGQGYAELQIELPKFRRRVEELDFKADSEGMIYSDLGDDEPSAREPRLQDAYDFNTMRGY